VHYYSFLIRDGSDEISGTLVSPKVPDENIRVNDYTFSIPLSKQEHPVISTEEGLEGASK
jgi:hypothetical protein